MPASRRRGRELALQALYEMDTAGHEPRAALERLIEDERRSQESAEFARVLLGGVLEHEAEIDRIIEAAAPAWPIRQIAPVDRNIMRLAIREFFVDNLTPVRAAINEAVELAKKYGSESSGRFVNGVLGSVSATAASPPGQEGH
jgi:N utilization substance protein B